MGEEITLDIHDSKLGVVIEPERPQPQPEPEPEPEPEPQPA